MISFASFLKLLLTILCCTVVLLISSSVQAAEAGKRINIAVVGDSIARGYCRGLKRQMATLPDVNILCWTKPSSGLTRLDFFDWNRKLQNLLKSSHIHYAIVSVGANDAQQITRDNRILKFSDPNWDEVYEARVSQMVLLFKEKGVEVYWLGMPIVRSPRYAVKMSRLNSIYTRATTNTGANYISIWKFTQSESGEYTRIIKGLSGRNQIARAQDGIHFSRVGEQIVSCYILREIKLFSMPASTTGVCQP